MTRIHSLAAFLTALLLLPLASCAPPGAGSSRTASDPLAITATTGMIGDVVRAVAAGRAEVTVIMGPGTDPHVYTPRRSDAATLASSDIIFYNGLHLEGRMGDLLGRLSARVPTHAVAEEVWEHRLDDATREELGEDPHLWMDPALWAEVTTLVVEILGEFDPSHAAAYQENAATYRAELEALHEHAGRVLSTIPENRRHLITAHDAFGYLGHAFDLDVHGIQGISTSSEAGLQDLNRLVDFIVANGIPAVFIESTLPDRNVRALIEGAASRGHTVVIGGELYSDAMGPAGTPQGVYTGMIRHNVETIARALHGGDTPDPATETDRDATDD